MKAEDFLKIVRDQGDNSPVFLLGTIPASYTTGRPTIQFDGESIASTRAYPYLSSYTPAANDRVLLAVVEHGAVILGKVI